MGTAAMLQTYSTNRPQQMSRILRTTECMIGPLTYHDCQTKSIGQMRS